MERYRSHTDGVALVIVLVLLAILTMLAIAGAGTATAELAMAGNEQYRRRALEASSAGIEQQLARIRRLGGRPGAAPTRIGPVSAGMDGLDSYLVESRHVGPQAVIAGYSIGKVSGQHFVIVSTGRSLRGALDVQTQGALILSREPGVSTSGSHGSGAIE